MISRVSRSDSRTMICRNSARSSGSRSGVSSRISENERIEVNGVRSSWLTVARKSSLSWSSWRSRSLASRSSAVACSSAADFCSSRWLYSIACEVSSRICIRSSGPITSPRTTEPTITRALAEPMARASWRSASWTSVASAAASGASTRPRRRRSMAKTVSARSWPRKRISSPRSAATVASPRHSSPRPRCCVDLDEQHRLQPLEVALAAEQPAQHDEAEIDAEAPDDGVADGAQAVEAEAAPAGGAARCPNGPSVTSAASTRPAVARVGSTSV